MRKMKKIISAIITVCFLLNTAVQDFALAQDLAQLRNSNTLATAAKTDDILGPDLQNLQSVSMLWKACLTYLGAKGFQPTAPNIKDKDILPDSVLNSIADIRMVRSSVTVSAGGVVIMQAKVRNGFTAPKTVWIRCMPNGDTQVYPDGQEPHDRSGSSDMAKDGGKTGRQKQMDIGQVAHDAYNTLSDMVEAAGSEIDYAPAPNISKIRAGDVLAGYLPGSRHRKFYICVGTDSGKGTVRALLIKSTQELDASDRTCEKADLDNSALNGLVHLSNVKDRKEFKELYPKFADYYKLASIPKISAPGLMQVIAECISPNGQFKTQQLITSYQQHRSEFNLPTLPEDSILAFIAMRRALCDTGDSLEAQGLIKQIQPFSNTFEVTVLGAAAIRQLRSGRAGSSDMAKDEKPGVSTLQDWPGGISKEISALIARAMASFDINKVKAAKTVIGVPKEIKPQAERVGLTPVGVKVLTSLGIPVVVQKGAGRDHFSDKQYLDAGAELVDTAKEVWRRSTLIKKVKEPLSNGQGNEYQYLRPKGQTIFTYFHSASHEARELNEQLIKSGTTAVAYETIQVDGRTPLLEPMSIIAGDMGGLFAFPYLVNSYVEGDTVKLNEVGQRTMAYIKGGYLTRFYRNMVFFYGNMLKGKEAVVLGGGVSGERMAMRLLESGASVTIADIKQERLDYLRNKYKKYSDRLALIRTNGDINDPGAELLAKLSTADVLGGCILVPGGKAPMLRRELLEKISRGKKKLIVDIALDQGGNFYGSYSRTYDNPVGLDEFGNKRFCVPNMPDFVGETASTELEKTNLAYTIALAMGLNEAVKVFPELVGGINFADGKIRHEKVHEAYPELPYEPASVMRTGSSDLAKDAAAKAAPRNASVDKTGTCYADIKVRKEGKGMGLTLLINVMDGDKSLSASIYYVSDAADFCEQLSKLQVPNLSASIGGEDDDRVILIYTTKAGRKKRATLDLSDVKQVEQAVKELFAPFEQLTLDALPETVVLNNEARANKAEAIKAAAVINRLYHEALDNKGKFKHNSSLLTDLRIAAGTNGTVGKDHKKELVDLGLASKDGTLPAVVRDVILSMCSGPGLDNEMWVDETPFGFNSPAIDAEIVALGKASTKPAARTQPNRTGSSDMAKDTAVTEVAEAVAKEVLDILGQRRGFTNGVVTDGRQAREIELDVIRNVLDLQIMGEDVTDYIKAIELLPYPEEYKVGLYTHDEMMHRPFWKDYFIYMTGRDLDTGSPSADQKKREKSVVYQEIKGFAKSAKQGEDPDKYARENFDRVSKAVADVLNWKPHVLAGVSLRERLTNLYALHVVRVVMKSVLKNDPKAAAFNPHEDTNKQANETAIEVVQDELRVPRQPKVVDELAKWLKLAIGGGMVDLNNPAIRDEYEQDPANFMEKHFSGAKDKNLGHQYFDEDLKLFCRNVAESKAKVKLVYFLDNNGEAVFDLAFIQKLMEINPNLTVYLVPKSTQVSNDASYKDIQSILNELDKKKIFASLNSFAKAGRFMVLQSGPTIQGVDGKRISKELADALEPEADRKLIGFFCGQANFETSQGWNIDRYYKLIAKGEGLEKASGFEKESRAYIFAFVPAGISVGTGDAYYKVSKDPRSGREIVTARQTLFNFEEALKSKEYQKLRNEAGSSEEAFARIRELSRKTGRTFAEIVFGCDAELHESLAKLGLMEREFSGPKRATALEETLWGKPDGQKSEFRKDVERLAGIEDLVKSQYISNKEEAEKRARAYLRAIAVRSAVVFKDKKWQDIRNDQESFNKLFGSSQMVAVAGRGSRYSRHVHKALVTADQGETNVRLAINGSYKTPGTKPIIVLSPNQLRWIVKDIFVPREASQLKAIEDSLMPSGWNEGVIPEDKIDPIKKAKYFTSDAVLLVGRPLGHGYVLTMSMAYLKEHGLLDDTAYQQIVFGEMATAQDRTKSNSSLITYMETVIGDYIITAGGKKADKVRGGGFDLAKKGNFTLKDGRLVALTDWSGISKDKQADFLKVGSSLKNWPALSPRERERLQRTFAVDPEGNILVNSNTVIFRNDVVKYLDEFNDRQAHPEYWQLDPKTSIPLNLAWDLIDLVAKTHKRAQQTEAWPIGFIDLGDAPSSIKDVERQAKFTDKFKAWIRASLDQKAFPGLEIADKTSMTIGLGADDRFNLNKLESLFTAGKGVTGVKLSGKLHLGAGSKIGNGVSIVNTTLAGSVRIGDNCLIGNAYFCDGVVVDGNQVIANAVIPEGRMVKKSVEGMMEEEAGIAGSLAGKDAGQCKDIITARLLDARDPGRYTSIAVVMTDMLCSDSEKVKSVLVKLSGTNINEYATLMRRMVSISSIFNAQLKLFDLLASLGKAEGADAMLEKVNYEITVDAIDEQSFTFDLLTPSDRMAQVYPAMSADEWAKYYKKSEEFFMRQLKAPDVSTEKKHEILRELVHGYPVKSSVIEALYEAGFGVNIIEDLKSRWTHDENVSGTIEVLIGEEALKQLVDLHKTDPNRAVEELAYNLRLVLGHEDSSYYKFLDVFGGIRGKLNGFIDRIIRETGMSFRDVVLADKNPLNYDSTVKEPWKNPKIVAFMGGTGGAPTLLMENLLNELIGSDVTMGVIGSPFDDGGSSRKAQDQLMAARWGYFPSPGDPVNVLSVLTKKEGDPLEAKRAIIRTRFDKGEAYKKQAEKLGLAPNAGFEDWLLKFLQAQTQELMTKGREEAPLDWLYFIKYADAVASALDERLVKPGILKLEGGSVGNFVYMGSLVRGGALTSRGRVGEKTYNPALVKLANHLGVYNGLHLPSSLDPATLYIKLEALELLVNGKRVQLRSDEDKSGKHTHISIAGLYGIVDNERGFNTSVDGTDTRFDIDRSGNALVSINGVQAKIVEDFGREVHSGKSKATVSMGWDIVSTPQILVQHGNYLVTVANPGPEGFDLQFRRIIREFHKERPDTEKGREFTLRDGSQGGVFDVSEGESNKEKGWFVSVYSNQVRTERIAYDSAPVSITESGKRDERAAGIRVIKSREGKLAVEVTLDTKGQGTTVYFRDTPVVFRNRLVIEQTNITESLHTSKVVETGFIDGAKPTANQLALDMIKSAQEAITIGPGSFITSTLPILMHPEIIDALRGKRKEGIPVIFIVNPFKDNETVDATVPHLLKLIEAVINKDRNGNGRLKASDIISHIIVNNADSVPDDLRPKMYEMTEEKINGFMKAVRDPSDFAGPAKLSRGPLDITQEEMRSIAGIKVYRESLATNIGREVRTAGKAKKELALGYSGKGLGQIIEHIILERKMPELEHLPIYQEVLERFYANDNGLLNADIMRLLYESDWLYTAGAIIRTPLEVLSEIKRKREEIRSGYIGSDEIAKNSPRVIIANAAHVLARYQKPFSTKDAPVEHISSAMQPRIEAYLKSGGVLVIVSALSMKELEGMLVNSIAKELRSRIILVPYAGTRAWRYKANGDREEEPFIDYSYQLTDEQKREWERICVDAQKTYELDRYLYHEDETTEPIDAPVVVNNRDGILINFEMDGRRNLPDQVVARINEKLIKKGGPEKGIFLIKRVGTLNDERDAVIAYLNKRFEDAELPLVAERSGTGAINTRLSVINRGKVAKEIIRLLNKEAINSGKPVYEEERIYVVGNGNEVILKALPKSNGVYFREEPVGRPLPNVRVYAGSYGLPGVEEFFGGLPSKLVVTPAKVRAATPQAKSGSSDMTKDALDPLNDKTWGKITKALDRIKEKVGSVRLDTISIDIGSPVAEIRSKITSLAGTRYKILNDAVVFPSAKAFVTEEERRLNIYMMNASLPLMVSGTVLGRIGLTPEGLTQAVSKKNSKKLTGDKNIVVKDGWMYYEGQEARVDELKNKGKAPAAPAPVVQPIAEEPVAEEPAVLEAPAASLEKPAEIPAVAPSVESAAIVSASEQRAAELVKSVREWFGTDEAALLKLASDKGVAASDKKDAIRLLVTSLFGISYWDTIAIKTGKENPSETNYVGVTDMEGGMLMVSQVKGQIVYVPLNKLTSLEKIKDAPKTESKPMAPMVKLDKKNNKILMLLRGGISNGVYAEINVANLKDAKVYENKGGQPLSKGAVWDQAVKIIRAEVQRVLPIIKGAKQDKPAVTPAPVAAREEDAAAALNALAGIEEQAKPQGKSGSSDLAKNDQVLTTFEKDGVSISITEYPDVESQVGGTKLSINITIADVNYIIAATDAYQLAEELKKISSDIKGLQINVNTFEDMYVARRFSNGELESGSVNIRNHKGLADLLVRILGPDRTEKTFTTEQIPSVQSVLENFRRFSSLPVSLAAEQPDYTGRTPSDIWSEFFSKVVFTQDVVLRAEREGPDSEQLTGVTAFRNAIEDTDVVQLSTYTKTTNGKVLRTGEQMKKVLMDENAPVTPEAYFMYRGIFANRADIQKAFYDNKVRYDVTIIPPALWGAENAKTFGHYHNPVEKPEVYQVLSGEAIYYMQKCDAAGKVIDVITVKAKAGDIVVMLPGYGHVSVNTSATEPLIMANWLTWHQTSYYGSFGDLRGGAYYIVRGRDGNPALVPNPKYMEKYGSIPQARQMRAVDNMPQFGLQRGVPIYDLVRGERFAENVRFLNEPEKYEKELTPEATLQEAVGVQRMVVLSAVPGTRSGSPDMSKNEWTGEGSDVEDLQKLYARQNDAQRRLEELIDKPEQFEDRRALEAEVASLGEQIAGLQASIAKSTEHINKTTYDFLVGAMTSEIGVGRLVTTVERVGFVLRNITGKVDAYLLRDTLNSLKIELEQVPPRIASDFVEMISAKFGLNEDEKAILAIVVKGLPESETAAAAEEAKSGSSDMARQDAQVKGKKSVLAEIMKFVHAEWLDGFLDMTKIAKIMTAAGLKHDMYLGDDESVLVFSRISAFGEYVDEKNYQEGLLPFLPSLIKSGVKVAVVAETPEQKALVEELNKDLKGREIAVLNSPDDAILKMRGVRRFYYFKVAKEGDVTGLHSITIVVQQILNAIGRVLNIVDEKIILDMHEAAKRIAIAA